MADNRIIQRGKARVLTASGTYDAWAQVATQSLRAKHNWDGSNIKDSAGFEFAWDARNTHVIITVSLKLTGASKAAAIANGAFLEELDEVVLADFDLPWLNSTGVGGYYTGSWCYHEGGTIDLSNDQPGGMEVSLRKFKDPTQNAAQFTTPS